MLVGGDTGGLRQSQSGLTGCSQDLAGVCDAVRGTGGTDVGHPGVAAALQRFAAAATGTAFASSAGVATLGKAASTNAELLDAALGAS